MARWLGLLGAFLLTLTPAAAAAPYPGSLTPVRSSPCLSEPGVSECPQHAFGLSDAVAAVASPDGRFVYVAGYGSSAIAELRRGADGSLTPVAGHGCIADADLPGDPGCIEQSHGLGGVSALSITPDGQYLYAAAQGSGGGAISWFSRRSDGSLAALACLNESGGSGCGAGRTANGLANASGVVVAPDAKNVYVASSTSNAVAEFVRHPDGSLTPLNGHGCIGSANTECRDSGVGLANATGITISADGRNLYVAAGDDVAELLRNADGSLSSIPGRPCTGSPLCGSSNQSPGTQSVVSVAISADQQNVYAGGGQDVAEFTRRSDGSLRASARRPCIEQVGGSGCGAGNTAIGLEGVDDVASAPDGGDVYASANDMANPGSVAILQRNPAAGYLFEAPGVECVMEPSSNQACPRKVLGLTAPGGLAIPPDGRNVYVAAGSLAELGRVLVAPSVTHAAIVPARYRPSQGHPTVRWLLSGPATIRFTVHQLTSGRAVHHGCVTPNRRNRKQPICTRDITLGSFSRAEPAGPGSLIFSGGLIGRRLATGRYLLVLRPSAAAQRGEPVTLRFRVL